MFEISMDNVMKTADGSDFSITWKQTIVNKFLRFIFLLDKN